MLSVILFIIKIIGILILVLLGLVITLILTVLLVPIRYRIAIEHGEDMFRMQGRVYWLLHILHGKITHLNGKLHIRVRLFGFVIYDNLSPRKSKKNLRRRKATTKARSTKNKPPEKLVLDEEERTETGVSKVADIDTMTERRVTTDTGTVTESQVTTDTGTVTESKVTTDTGTVTERKVTTDTVAELKIGDEIKINKPDTITEPSGEFYDGKNAKSSEKGLSLLQKLGLRFKKIIDKIMSFKGKIYSFFKGLKEKLIKIGKNISNLKRKLDLISDFIKDEINKEGFSVTFASIKKLLKHILPQKLNSRFVFGTGDPCSTGQILGVLGVLYGIYGDKIQIIPDFEDARFEGKHYARGRIRLGTLLIIVIKLILDKRFKQLKGNFKILKEAL